MFLVYEEFYGKDETVPCISEEDMMLHITRESALWDLQKRKEEYEDRGYTYIEDESGDSNLTLAQLIRKFTSENYRLTEVHIYVREVDVAKDHNEVDVIEQRNLRKIKHFLFNLTDEQIDLENKLGNMCDSEICNEVLYGLLVNSEAMKRQICDCIKRTVKIHSDVWSENILDEMERLIRNKIIENEEEYESGLYNMDKLYCEAIKEALRLNYDYWMR